MVPLWWYIVLGVVLFVIGAAGVLLRRNIIVVLMSLELMLNSVNINFIAFGRYHADFRG
ncbi:NADH-quinone oxidoreductase subunit NuoK, partial [Rhizobium ruizarguesonis]